MESNRTSPAPPPAVPSGGSSGLAGPTSARAKRSFLRELPEPDVFVVTSGGRRIPAHTGILASVSPVLENLIYRPSKRRSSEKIVPILGVPCNAVSAFIEFVYSSRCTEEEMEKYDVHLLALAHVYSVPQLKQRCVESLRQRLTVDSVVDLLQLSRLCSSPELELRCMKLVHHQFKAVEQTEGWRFLQHHDPWLELDILHFIDESESRKKRTKRQRDDQKLYLQLSEAMDCLEHICTEGCTSVGPHDADPATVRKEPCGKFATCQGLQTLIRHFAACGKRVSGGCGGCKSVWRLLRLHAAVCDQPDSCKVPLCRQLKLRSQREKRKDGARWRLLARKVASAKAMSSLSQAMMRRRRPEEVLEMFSRSSRARGGTRSFKLGK
ncbi:hypothetical protein EUGRSUZ_B00171 [Eucalyptus grandis]|uniref:Uncharacterized protein n=2 Tax=Eucalyptus grandis TaxID=71139 RepID=A0ACC3LLE5_EUCGR|nr:hypothetical protein EUGRSUZ_B00171 [Eucalyptus grandis]